MASPSVLIADDSPAFRSALHDFLEDRGCSVVAEAGSGEAAIAMSGSLSPEFVFMDARMPGIGGIEACRRINRLHPGIRVVVLSASFREVDIHDAVEGASAVLTKYQILEPGRLDDLLADLCAKR